MQLSIIIPVLNESARIGQCLSQLQGFREAGHEIIVVDGGSEDDSQKAAQDLCDKWLISERGRARQMNAGAKVASGETLLFLHADTILPEDALEQLTRFHASDALWGRFDIRLSGSRVLYRLIGWLINWRSRLTGICTGDQAQFVRRQTFESLGGFPDIPLMEDVALSASLKKQARPYCIPSKVITDSRRWEKHGPWRTVFLMWHLRFDYWRGVAPEVLVERYYE